MFVLVPVCSGLHALMSTSGVLLISILCLESGSLTELGTHRFKEIILSVSPQDWTDSPPPPPPSTGVTGACCSSGFYMGARNPNLGCRAYITITLATK